MNSPIDCVKLNVFFSKIYTRRIHVGFRQLARVGTQYYKITQDNFLPFPILQKETRFALL